MKKSMEKLFYSFGITSFSGLLSKELNILKNKLPDSFKGRDVIDIGCGDGKVSLKLKEVLKSRTYKGVDLYQPLVVSAKKR